ncbi:MAG: hypothetical protein C7B45_07390 [Sulfobacillus acidophilus]|uniref:SIS domain-containing protein n=1 Tax=Sulfobacillus acidophilus TaxID=53633 RepID=A0A2T2WJB2_9FIRM|nr:MAG: hypothetical protein C7B45_07390 [Sulfobacillus acidophilus]
MTNADGIARYVDEAWMKAWVANREVVPRVARKIVEVHLRGHRVYAFGSGHSHMLVEEMYYRAGGLTIVSPIWEPSLMLHEDAERSSVLEQTPGISRTILDRVHFEAGDLLWLISNSGRNPLIVELAAAAKLQGASVIALMSLTHALAVTPRSVSHQRLNDIADEVIDNGGVLGDAGYYIEGLAQPMFPTSTMVGAGLVNWIWVEVARQLMEAGVTPTVLTSFNVDQELPQDSGCGVSDA